MTVVEVCPLPAELVGALLPPLHLVEQRFAAPAPVDAAAEVERQWQAAWAGTGLPPGSSVAVAVGSRGIAGVAEVTRKVVERLRGAGCHPFVVPAMGSHGNAGAAGQTAVLAELGITEAGVGAPVQASMDVVHFGEADGLPLYSDRLAGEADGIVLINRVKPHTDFVGPFESGLMKMLVIGLGNDAGATACHRHAITRGLSEVLTVVGRALLEHTRVVLGVALLEDQFHRTTAVQLVPPSEWERAEQALLERARALLPRLPLDDIDVLLVDEMGKDVSGAGMDPNVTGRTSGCWSAQRLSPRITRIVALRLSAASEGNAVGIGSVDIAPRRLVDAVDLPTTAMNDLVSCAPEDCKIPLTFADDRQALLAALGTLRPYTLHDLRLVHIRNTLALERLEVSAGCLDRLSGDAGLVAASDAVPLAFDDRGTLLSRLA